MRVSKKERKENARRFYRSFKDSYNQQAAIIVNRTDSNCNPNINRCQLFAVISNAESTKPVMIAESTTAELDGCFRELLTSIDNCPQKSYHDSDFDAWIKKTYGFTITYNDGFVIMLSK